MRIALVFAAVLTASGFSALSGPAEARPASAPPNPFASNYPSAAPPAAVERRRSRTVRGHRPDGTAPVPPGRIPH